MITLNLGCTSRGQNRKSGGEGRSTRMQLTTDCRKSMFTTDCLRLTWVDSVVVVVVVVVFVIVIVGLTVATEEAWG